MLIWSWLACTGAADESPTPTEPVDSAAATTDTTDTVEAVGPSDHLVDENADTVFVGDVIHELSLEIPLASMSALQVDPRSYVAAEFSDGSETVAVGIRLKGNTSFTWFDEKPAIIVKFDFQVPDQRYQGLPSVYLQNMTWDPSMVHEHLAYWAFRQADVPSSRTGYARLAIDGQDYGLYLLLEKQNSLFRKQWWDDTSGSVYEAGSFNHPCDLNDGSASDPCTCYEIDRVGEDSFDDLQAFCLAARATTPDWREQLGESLDWDVFLRAVTTEMIVSHYDNYGWNINNYRLYHEPTEGHWYWTPWSTDLSFGWYPWVDAPHCGIYGVTPSEYRGGFLVDRCWSDPECTADLLSTLSEQLDAFESWDMGSELERVVAMIERDLLQDPRSRYSDADAMGEIACVRDFVAGRAAFLRDWVAAQ